jgi:hypothetical protein
MQRGYSPLKGVPSSIEVSQTLFPPFRTTLFNTITCEPYGRRGEGHWFRCVCCCTDFSPPILPTYLDDVHLDQPPSQEGSHFGDSSGPLFWMYSKIAEKDDNTMAERWQKDADGILIFVSPQVRLYAITCVN